MLRLHLLTAICLLPCFASATWAREWSDVTGRYRTEAELIAFNATTAVLKKPDGQLVAVPVERLSEDDRKYLASREAEDQVNAANQVQKWPLKNGLELVGRVVGYGRRDVTIQRRRGKIYVNDRLLSNLPAIYQQMVPRVVEHVEGIELPTEKDFQNWVNRLRGQPRTYTLEGVRLELENGDEYAVPFFLFRDEDLAVLEPGWDEWLAAEKEQQQHQHDFYVESQARAYHQDEMRAAQQIAMMQLELLAVNAGLVDLWEVYLTPGPGRLGFPISVVVPARNSLQATTMALERNPGFMAGPVRRVSRR